MDHKPDTKMARGVSNVPKKYILRVSEIFLDPQCPNNTKEGSLYFKGIIL